MTLSIGSPAFGHGGDIPATFTCEGRNCSPALAWSGVPAGARSLVLIVDDPDAPDPKAPKRTWVHWLLYNVPVESSGLAEGVAPAELPRGTLEGITDFKRTGWGGPCPPIGRHRYYFRLFALDRMLPDIGHPDRASLEKAMAGHLIASAELMGTYEKRRI
ncbi:MAG: YbhB/YbcL family Raf kinase inhibitor-like protein [Gemmatimonadota bacterium]